MTHPDPHRGLDALFKPGSIAIVGASSDPRRFGGRPIQYLTQAGFPGGIFPINPSRSEIQGLSAYASLDAVGQPIDCALLAVGPEATIGAVDDCIRLGVKAAIILSAGFSEIGETGAARQAEMVARARAGGLRLLGPNCMGLFDARSRFYATFASAFEDGLAPVGNVGVASQSGGYGGYVLRHAVMREIGLACWATSGNECDVEIGELLGWMAGEADVEVLVAYMEGVRSGRSLITALASAQAARKPVVVMKVGRTAEGTAAAKSHTASLTGEDAVYDAVFDAYGVYRARTSDELLDVAYAASRGRLPRGRRTAILSMSGGIGVQMADFAADAGLVLSEVPEATRDRLRELVPFCSPQNPVDPTGQATADHHLLGTFTDALLGSGAFDALAVSVGIAGMAPSMAAGHRTALNEAYRRHPDQMVLLSITAPPDLVAAYREDGFLVFEDPSRAIAALGALARFAETLGRTEEAGDVPATEVPALGADGAFNEVAAKAMLEGCGVRPPRETLATDAAAAVEAATAIGYPVAVKIVSADIAHKTDVGGVALRLAGPDQVRDAVERMLAEIPRRLPDARIDGCLVSEMVTGGLEMIIGVTTDPVFGPVVTVGMGGVLTELYRDVAVAPAPVSPARARRMLDRLTIRPLLTGYRGGPAMDIEGLSNAVSRVSHLAASLAERIEGLEINPAVVMPGTGGVVALDAVITPRA